ncbi:hypothetical protein SKAU_G00070640 [Synaphobranchus kaupii]|uniref:DNA topoisomerase n=1 Tax=Synaphobranchus kaupii TaxID=118154 RepID=A0A9Q1J9H3_SYNKA|nr:hypothetical protein SKAU_G00070640 [Synaphobranchus kaupii]
MAVKKEREGEAWPTNEKRKSDEDEEELRKKTKNAVEGKEGMLKRRIQPEDVIINYSKQSRIPEPPAGHRWKEVRHDNTVTWLASWTENIQGSCKYIMLNASSKLKGEKDWEKYEVARRLNCYVDQIQSQYCQDMNSKEMLTRQRATALYFIDKLALRAGNEKEAGEAVDTVGCCSLRVEHITLHRQLDGNKYVVEFDFLGKDSIRYNKVLITKRSYTPVHLYIYLSHPLSLMIASDGQAEKLLAYNRANRAVAVLCNHQRAAPKNFEQSMATLQAKIDSKTQELSQAKTELKLAKWKAKGRPDSKWHTEVEKKRKATRRFEDQLLNLSIQATDREEDKQIALGTSKLNYLDPRISIAWCMKMNMSLDKIYSKSQREKFAWAIDMTKANFEF